MVMYVVEVGRRVWVCENVKAERVEHETEKDEEVESDQIAAVAGGRGFAGRWIAGKWLGRWIAVRCARCAGRLRLTQIRMRFRLQIAD